ncbi:MAG: transcription-repair coupling factor [Boseongicola sp.]|nr:transcription-repair coupling factor [Boseongicola sp.]
MSEPRMMTLSGAPEGLDASLVLRELETASRVCHVARDDKRMAAMAEALAFFAPHVRVLRFPGWDCLPYERVSPNVDISAERMATLARLACNAPGPFILLTTLNAATQRVPSRELVRTSSFAARAGEHLNEAALREFLTRMGFVQTPTVAEPGDYAVRGGIIDIFPPGEGDPVRLDLFGDVLEDVRRFDAATQRTVAQLPAVELSPVSEVILDEASISRFRQSYRLEFGAGGTSDPLYEAVSSGRRHSGMEHWLPFFHERLETIFDYLPDATITLDDRARAMHEARWEAVNIQYEARQEARLAVGEMNVAYKPMPPGLLYLDDAAWQAAAKGHRILQLAVSPQAVGPGSLDAGGRIGRDFAPERQQESTSLLDAVAHHIRSKARAGPVVIASYSEGAQERLQGLIADHDILGAVPISDFSDVPEGKGGVFHVVWALQHGFESREGLTVISEQDIFGDRLTRQPRKRRRADDFLTEARSLSPEDLIVHVEHGVGRYKGLEVVEALGAPHECIHLEYAGGDKLYLPVENIELLSRYGHEEAQLDRLGGAAWQARKAGLKRRIREIADRLVRIAAERHLRKAPIVERPEGLWEAFLARFSHQETDDQLAAIGETLDDLASGKPMDRLICGDVGFGKTEVAMRAAFAAAMSGVQVAVIAPTTLLARQHAARFVERFRGFPIEIRQLSRFVAAKEAARTRDGLADGTVDIVIGTHAVLARPVRFQNLGLLVVDEEQHFGVTHKERMKQLRSDIHVLTLTATPIPRTLQMSLTGVRDLSVIGTPPIDRLAIRTYVSEFDSVTLREALLREHYRGGQSFFVVPRVSDLPEIETWLSGQVPELTHVVVHGQLAAGTLDDRMNAFYEGRYDILLATTIVESGLDIPTANTMIVHRADMFGLAQLYQIRGRVGRSKARAYAYLTTRPNADLTVQAERRLRVLGSLDSLGAGFNLASQDLDIRGAGNILGEEQSGHIREVGFELFRSMLEDAISKIRSGESEGLTDTDEQWSPQIRLGVPVLIPEHYVRDLDVRLGLYRRLSNLSSKVEIEGFAAELIDRFGKLPREANALLLVVRIKNECRKAGIARLDTGPKGATIQFHENRFANPDGLVEFIRSQNGLAKIRSNKLIVRRDWRKARDRVQGAFVVARELASRARV